MRWTRAPKKRGGIQVGVGVTALVYHEGYLLREQQTGYKDGNHNQTLQYLVARRKVSKRKRGLIFFEQTY